MADQKPEIKIEDKDPFTDNVELEYRNYSSVARKPFEGEGEKSNTKATGKQESPKAPAASSATKASGSDNK